MGVWREFGPQGDPSPRTARFNRMPSYASCPYTADYDAELAERALDSIRAEPSACWGARRCPSRSAITCGER